MSYSVARRRNEIGVRIALGAGRARVIRMVLGDVGKIILAGRRDRRRAVVRRDASW